MLGMRIEDVRVSETEVTVTTTGTIYTVKKSDPGEIICTQRIGKQKLRAAISVEASFEGLNVDYHDDERCILYQPVVDWGFNIRINARIPCWVGWDAYVDERQKAIGRQFRPQAETHKILKEDYFPALDRLMP